MFVQTIAVTKTKQKVIGVSEEADIQRYHASVPVKPFPFSFGCRRRQNDVLLDFVA